MVTATTSAHDIAAATPDPELPMLTVADLGILRAVDVTAGGVIVTITPTYSGCPAMREISADVRHRLEQAGFGPVTVRTQLAPPWSSDWVTREGRRKLAAVGGRAGRDGVHTEAMGYILAELQSVARAYPDATW